MRKMIKEIFGVGLVSIISEHQREVRESERLKRKSLNPKQIMACEQVLC